MNVILGLFIAALLVLTAYASCAAEDHDTRCVKAGGVPFRGACFAKAAIIEVPR